MTADDAAASRARRAAMRAAGRCIQCGNPANRARCEPCAAHHRGEQVPRFVRETARKQAVAAYIAHPTATTAQLAAMVGCGARTVRLALQAAGVVRRNAAPRRPPGTPRATVPPARCGAYAIFDLSEGRVYLDVGYATQMAASAALHDLLRPYPKGSPWRSALVVVRSEPHRVVHRLERRNVRPRRPVQEVLL